MMKRAVMWPLMATATVLVMLAAMIGTATNPHSYAQGNFTPTASSTAGGVADASAHDDYAYDDPARVENGEAEWVVSESRFINNYPDGFAFMGNATSTGGNLVSVSVLYSSVGDPEFSLRQRGEVNPETGAMRVVVEGTNADDIPPWSAINYQWRITDEAGTVYFSDWMIGAEYADYTRQWTRLETDDALVFIQEGLSDDIADLMFLRLDEKHDQYMQAFSEPLNYTPRIVLFADQTAFNEWRSLDVVQGGMVVVGLAMPARGIIMQYPLRNDAEDLANIVVHEVTHLYQYAAYQSRALNWWTEGEATYFEFLDLSPSRDRVQFFAATNQLPPLFAITAPLTASSNGPDGRGAWGYDLGYTFYDYFIDNYGYEGVRELYALLDAPENVTGTNAAYYDLFISSLEAVTGVSIASLEMGWRQSVGAPAAIPTLYPTPTVAFIIPPTVTPFGQ